MEKIMLRTKKAIGNIRAYIMDNFTPENYTDNPPKDFPGAAAAEREAQK